MDMPSAGTTLITTIIVAVLSGGLSGAVLNWYSKERELDVKMVEVGLGVLRDNEEQAKYFKNWALRTVESYSGTKFTVTEREALLRSALLNGDSYVSVSVLEKYTKDDSPLASKCSAFGEKKYDGLKDFIAALEATNDIRQVKILAADQYASYESCSKKHDAFVEFIREVAATSRRIDAQSAFEEGDTTPASPAP